MYSNENDEIRNEPLAWEQVLHHSTKKIVFTSDGKWEQRLREPFIACATSSQIYASRLRRVN